VLAEIRHVLLEVQEGEQREVGPGIEATCLSE
jgi:hypothetical protein